MVTLVKKAVNMQVGIVLVNNFHTDNPVKLDKLKERISRNLSIKEANALYEVLDKILIKLESKGQDYWNNIEKVPDKLYNLILDDIKKESLNSLAEEDFSDIYIGE